MKWFFFLIPSWDSAPSPSGWVFFHTSKQFSDTTRWVSYNLTHFWHYLPEDTIRSHRLELNPTRPPTSSHFRCPSQLLIVTCASEPPAIDLKTYIEPPRVWWIFTKSGETIHLLDCWFIIKGYNSRTARWKRCIGQGRPGRREPNFHALSKCHSPRLSIHQPGTCLPTWKLPKPSASGFIWQLHYTSMIDHIISHG